MLEQPTCEIQLALFATPRYAGQRFVVHCQPVCTYFNGEFGHICNKSYYYYYYYYCVNTWNLCTELDFFRHVRCQLHFV